MFKYKTYGIAKINKDEMKVMIFEARFKIFGLLFFNRLKHSVNYKINDLMNLDFKASLMKDLKRIEIEK